MDEARLALEVNLLRQAGNPTFTRSGDTIFATERVVHAGVPFAYRISFPPDYPYRAPRVDLLHPTLPVSVTVHRFNDGSLCLWGSEEWHPSNTGVWVRGRALAWLYALLRYSEGCEWPEIGPR